MFPSDSESEPMDSAVDSAVERSPHSADNYRQLDGDGEQLQLSTSNFPAVGLQLLKEFPEWENNQKMSLVQALMLRLSHKDLLAVQAAVSPILRRDFISLLPSEIAEKILSYLDPRTLCLIEQVSRTWLRILRSADSVLWRRMLEEKMSHSKKWLQLGRRAQGILNEGGYRESLYKTAYSHTERFVMTLARNWELGLRNERFVESRSNGIYCLQFDDEKIVTGSRDHKIKIWDMRTLAQLKEFIGHEGSVLCLQFDDHKIISGSSDATVIVWDINTGQPLHRLRDHSQSVLHLKFNDTRLVTCSKDKKIIVWTITQDHYIKENELLGHRAAVNVVEFDDQYIVSASGDRTIRLWDTNTGEALAELRGHDRGIACLQYYGQYIVSGSSDTKLKIWSIPRRECVRTLTGHQSLVRCVRFNEKVIVSGSYDNSIRVWKFETGEHLYTLQGHTNRVFRVQFDDFKIVSSSQDDQIRVWDFTPDEKSLL
eukprot:m.188358 g.188358  ORF g.188358 m.188358 type:complete len:484 (-) comp15616_c0_seq3:1875-3326(-)